MGFLNPDLVVLAKIAKDSHGIRIIKEEMDFGVFYDALKGGKVIGMARSEDELCTLLKELMSEKESMF